MYTLQILQCICRLTSTVYQWIQDLLKLRVKHDDKQVRKAGGQTLYYWQVSCGLTLSLRCDHSVGLSLLYPTRSVISRTSAYIFVTLADQRSAYRSPRIVHSLFFRPDRMMSAGRTDPAGTQQPVSMIASRAVG